MLVFATFLAFVLADNRNVPKEESMIRMLVRMLCNMSRSDKSDRTLDCISRSVLLFKGATLQKLIAFDYMNQLPMWSFKCSLNGDQTNALFNLLGAIHEDTMRIPRKCSASASIPRVKESTKMEKHHIFPKGFVYDQNPGLSTTNLLQHTPQPLLNLTLVFRASYQRPHIELKNIKRLYHRYRCIIVVA